MPRAKPKPSVKAVATLPDDGRRPRNYWPDLVGIKSWDDVLDGGTYKIKIPEAKGTDMLDRFLASARVVVRKRAAASGRKVGLRTDRKDDTTVTIQVVDRGPA